MYFKIKWKIERNKKQTQAPTNIALRVCNEIQANRKVFNKMVREPMFMLLMREKTKKKKRRDEKTKEKKTALTHKHKRKIIVTYTHYTLLLIFNPSSIDDVICTTMWCMNSVSKNKTKEAKKKKMYKTIELCQIEGASGIFTMKN